MTSIFVLPKTDIADPVLDPPVITSFVTPDDISGIQTTRQQLWTTGKFKIRGVDVELDISILERSTANASASNGLYGTALLKKFAAALEIPNPTSMTKPALIGAILSKIKELTQT